MSVDIYTDTCIDSGIQRENICNFLEPTNTYMTNMYVHDADLQVMSAHWINVACGANRTMRNA